MSSTVSSLINSKCDGLTPSQIVFFSSFGTVGALFLTKFLLDPSGTYKSTIGMLMRNVRRIPFVDKQIKTQQEEAATRIAKGFEKYDYEKFAEIPQNGWSHEEIMKMMKEMKEKEDKVIQEGKVSGGIYHGGSEHMDFLGQIMALFAISNPLHPDIWPSIRKFEVETIRMTLTMLNGDETTCGAMTSGGTESILLAVKAYRDRARALYGITEPELVAPTTAHAAFEKGAQYFGLKYIRVPVDSSYRVDLNQVRKAITRNTVMLVGSAPQYPHGMIDPLTELGKIAQEFNIPLHSDCCLGGYLLPWWKKLGKNVPDFDFTIPGVTSISIDTHKYGYAPKGTSVICFRNADYRKYMYYVTTEWPGGIYCTATTAGSRPGALIASTWASLVAMGQKGFMDVAEQIWAATQQIKRGVESIDGLELMGDSKSSVVAFTSSKINIYALSDRMSKRGWSLNPLTHPPGLHVCVTKLHIPIVDQLLNDLRETYEETLQDPTVDKHGMAPIYGLASGLPDRELVDDLIGCYLDAVLKG